MTKKYISLALLLTFGVVPVNAQSDEVYLDNPSGRLVIAAVSAGLSSASDEHIILANNSADYIDLSGVELQYASSQSTKWTRKAELSGYLAPHSVLSLSSLSNLDGDQELTFSSGLAYSGGHLRLALADKPIDLLGWGTALYPEGLSALKLDQSNYLLRLELNDEPEIINPEGQQIIADLEAQEEVLDKLEQIWQDTDVNADDFLVTNVLPPLNPNTQLSDDVMITSYLDEVSTLLGTIPELEIEATGEDLDAMPQVQDFRMYSPLIISELLPDPVSPLTDTKDEFIELYNPNDFDINLYGLRLETGSNYSKEHSFTEADVITANGYFIIKSGDANFSLSNSGSSVRLIAGDGEPWGDAVSYAKAQPGHSYAYDGATYSWSTQPTPGASNLLVAPPAKVSAVKKTATEAPKKPADKNNPESDDYTPPAEIAPRPSMEAVAGFSSIALLYGGYEYRKDFIAKISWLRRHLRFGKKIGQ